MLLQKYKETAGEVKRLLRRSHSVVALSLLVAIGYFIFKLRHWDSLSIGMAPILIGFFFFASVQLFFIGILGEYIANIHTQVQKRPLVVERERINFQERAP